MEKDAKHLFEMAKLLCNLIGKMTLTEFFFFFNKYALERFRGEKPLTEFKRIELACASGPHSQYLLSHSKSFYPIFHSTTNTPPPPPQTKKKKNSISVTWVFCN